MKPNQWLALANFHTHAVPQKLEILQARREALFRQQRELLMREDALVRQMHELVERQTAHELQSRLFWCKLHRSALMAQKDEV